MAGNANYRVSKGLHKLLEATGLISLSLTSLTFSEAGIMHVFFFFCFFFRERAGMSVRDLPHKTQQREYIGARQPIVSAVYCLAAVSHLAVLAVFFFFLFSYPG